jgi:hypothetical protein
MNTNYRDALVAVALLGIVQRVSADVKFNSFARITHEAISRFFRRDAPAFFTVPFGHHRIDAIKTSLTEAARA